MSFKSITPPPSSPSRQGSKKVRRLEKDADISGNRNHDVLDSTPLNNPPREDETMIPIEKEQDPPLPSLSLSPSSDHYPILNDTHGSDVHEITESPNQPIVDAQTFIFRSPATQDEIHSITEKVKSQICFARDVLKEGGYEAYKKLKRHQRKLQILDGDENLDVNMILKGYDEEEGDDDDINNGEGMDTDDELHEVLRNKEQLAMIEEAVVKGDPRRYQGMLFFKYICLIYLLR